MLVARAPSSITFAINLSERDVIPLNKIFSYNSKHGARIYAMPSPVPQPGRKYSIVRGRPGSTYPTVASGSEARPQICRLPFCHGADTTTQIMM